LIIFDEKEYVEKLLKCGFQQPYNKRFKDVFILAKYYKYNKYSKKRTIRMLTDYMIKYDNEFEINRGNDNEIIAKIVHNVYSHKYHFRHNESVGITKGEIDKILQLKNKNEKQIAFVLLVLSKLYRSRRIYVQKNDLIKLSSVCEDRGYCDNILGYLDKINYIDIAGGLIEVLFVDKESEIIAEINDFNNLIEQLYVVLNKYSQNETWCIKCGGQIEKTSNRTKYCPACWKEEERKLKRECWNKNKDKYRS
jgi:predicted RNA-binding Zn-ribbon protein involved in translation (DUF1610 family)